MPLTGPAGAAVTRTPHANVIKTVQTYGSIWGIMGGKPRPQNCTSTVGKRGGGKYRVRFLGF